MGSSTSSYARVWNGRLDDLPDPPNEQLYARGEHDRRQRLAAPTVAIVGARACSDYGAQVARTLGRELATAGVTVVSGLARGIDGRSTPRRPRREAGARSPCSAAASTATIPRAHAELARRIAETGGIVSEYEPGVEPAPWRFPARNRIIAALADVVVIVEARERSGALITVDLAMEIGRPIYAVPGEITSAPLRGNERAAPARPRQLQSRPRSMYSQRSESEDRPYEHASHRHRPPE